MGLGNYMSKKKQIKQFRINDPDHQSVQVSRQDLKRLDAERNATRRRLKQQTKQRTTIKRIIFEKKQLVKMKVKYHKRNLKGN